MKLSIAMTTYCGEQYVEEQLESLLMQTRSPDEVVIFDDVSTDRTAELVTAFIERNCLENWKFAVNEKNLGFIANFRRAISATSGDIIFLCDQDDIWNLDKLESFEKKFIAHPDILALNGSFNFIDGDGKRIKTKKKHGRSNHGLVFFDVNPGDLIEIPYIDIIKGNISPGCCMAFRAELKEHYLGNTTGLIPHDWELNIFACEKGKLGFYNIPVIQYRIHGENAIGIKPYNERIQKTFLSNREKRLKILYEQEKMVEFLSNQIKAENLEILTYVKHYKSFLETRKKCLLGHNVFAWFHFWKHYRFLLPNDSLISTILGDLIYALRLEKILGEM